MKIRIGVIGGGFGARVHIPAFRLHPRCEIRALWSRNPDKAKKTAIQENIPIVYSDWRAMVKDPFIDALSVAVPPALQSEIAALALRHKKPLFLEKPLSANLKKAEKINALAKRNKVPVMVDFEFPELSTWGKAKAKIESGHLGKLSQVVVMWKAPPIAPGSGKSWKDDESKGGGLFYNYGSHVFYYLEWLLGPIDKIQAHFGSSIAINMVSKSGLPLSFFLSRPVSGEPSHEVWLMGEKRTLKLQNSSRDHIYGFRLMTAKQSGIFRSIHAEKKVRGIKDGRIVAVGKIMGRFLTSIENNRNSVPSIEDGVRVEKIMAAARRSAKLEKWVRL